MENIKDDDEEHASEEGSIDVATVFRNIYCSCDIDGTDSVPVSRLIEFIHPFMIEDLNALEELKKSLDPENKDIVVTSERFYDVINQWSRKIAAGSPPDDFYPSNPIIAIDDTQLPYTHSTPRTSLGDKLLKCKDLLNLSNMSGYSLSTSRLDTTNHTDIEKTALEEEVKRLERQLLKLTNELTITKQQLTASEEQNDVLQQNFDRLNKKLHCEQQINEDLQKEIDRKNSEELKEEVNTLKETIDTLKKNLLQSEKDNLYFKSQISEVEEEKAELEKNNGILTKQNQECLREIANVRANLESKEEQVSVIQKVYDELNEQYAEQRDTIDQLKQRIEILSENKVTLEKVLKNKLSISGSLSSGLDRHESSEEDLNWKLVSSNISGDDGAEQNGNSESLQLEIRKADVRLSHYNSNSSMVENYDLVSTLKDEVITLKEELEDLQTERTDLIKELEELKNNNKDLRERNFVLINDVETSQTEITYLKENAEKQMRENEEQFNKKMLEKELELKQFKDNLERNIVKEFEGKVKDSVEAEEQILNLDFKCSQLEQDLKNVSSQLRVKEQRLTETQEHTKSLKSEIDVLQTTVSKLESEKAYEITKINSTLVEVQRHVENRDAIINELKAINECMSYNLHQSETSLMQKMEEMLYLKDGLEQDINVNNKLWHQMAMLRNDLTESHRLNEELTRKFDDLKIEHNTLLITHDEEVQKCIKYNAEISLLTEENNTYVSNYKILQEDFKKLETDYKSQTKAREKLEQNLSSLNERIKELNEIINVKKSDGSSQTEVIDDISEEASEILEELERKLISEMSKNSSMVEELQQVKTALNKKDFELAALKLKVNENETEMTKRIEEFIEKHNKLSEELFKSQNNNQTEIASLKKELAQKTKENISINNELDRLRNQYAAKVKETQNNEAILIKKQKEMDNEITILKKELAQKTEENISINNELDRLKNQYAAKVKEAESNQVILIERQKEMDTEITILRKELAEKTEENKQTKNQCVAIVREAENNQVVLTEKQKEMDGLQIKYDNLLIELKEIQGLHKNSELILNNTKIEYASLEEKFLVLSENNMHQIDLVRQSEQILRENRDELKKVSFEKEILDNELIKLKDVNAKLQEEYIKILTNFATLEDDLKKVRREKEFLNNELSRLTEVNTQLNAVELELIETKKVLEKKSGLNTSNSEKDVTKGKSYFRQQMTIDRLKEKVECLEAELQREKSKYEELKIKLSLADSEILSLKAISAKDEANIEKCLSDCTSESKTVNKFTLCSAKIQTTCPSEPILTPSETVIEVPPLHIKDLAAVVQDIELNSDCSKDELENKVLTVISVFHDNSNNKEEEIIYHTEKYKKQYERIVTLLSDVSQRLRDHVCIGTAEPIMPVFVLLEEIKIQMKQLVENVGQVGALLYENNLKKFWSLFNEYVSSVKTHEEFLPCEPLEENVLRKRHRKEKDTGKQNQETKKSSDRKRFLPKKLMVLVLSILAIALIISLIVHMNCRMTVSESQYCPLDGIITRINEGLPPM
ncbi:putative leucine-rich repeat-containing protein DDB_G0290503 isoform X2 [Sitophilus oryzae]|uniref:Leucine-rich repeat-containing protein DDB_G0290503 isoform X2 n=1 Tax=Sitophilus oryzae TaxID=7048 RepID=A0A6J2X8Y0_SITOR|nr:putative leucine-rich repeat-containing protein DDB_G0290503 isoform X2 [Sitophilus oryzae]